LIFEFIMDILESDKMKIKILKCLFKERQGVSLNGLKKKIGASNFKSVKRNCDFLELMNLISMQDVMKIERKRINPQNYRLILITDNGRKVIEKLTKK